MNLILGMHATFQAIRHKEIRIILSMSRTIGKMAMYMSHVLESSTSCAIFELFYLIYFIHRILELTQLVIRTKFIVLYTDLFWKKK